MFQKSVQKIKSFSCLATLAITFSFPDALAEGAIIDVNGLVCEFCAVTIQKSFNKKNEIKEVSVDLATKKVSLIFKDEQSLSNKEITEVIVNNGYNVVKIEKVDS